MNKGFYAARTSHAWVFAYTGHDAVWIRTGMGEEDSPLDDDFEGEWELPSGGEELKEFLKRYGFEKITSSQAEPYVRKYLYRVIEVLHPDSNKEILADPNVTIEFVRLVKDFLIDLESL